MLKLKPLALLLLALVAAARAGDATSLLEATYAGDAARVAALIKAGADVNEANQFGATPMSQAALRGDSGVLRLLLKGGGPQHAGLKVVK